MNRIGFQNGFRGVSLSLLILMGCSSGGHHSESSESRPVWTTQPMRTVDQGYIIYLGSGEDSAQSQAYFKAQSEAIENIANECSFAPKGARTEDRYDETLDYGKHRVYVKAAVTFADCEAAQKAVDPEEIKKLANIQFAEELKRTTTY